MFNNTVRDPMKLIQVVFTAFVIALAVVLSPFTGGLSLTLLFWVVFSISLSIGILGLQLNSRFLQTAYQIVGLVASIMVFYYGTPSAWANLRGILPWPIMSVVTWAANQPWYYQWLMFAFTIFSSAVSIYAAATGMTWAAAFSELLVKTAKIIGQITGRIIGALTNFVGDVLGAAFGGSNLLTYLAVGVGAWFVLKKWSNSRGDEKISIGYEERHATA